MVQQHLPVPQSDPYPDSTHIGIPVSHTDPKLQSDVFAELVNKFSWAVGSTYRRTYNGKRSLVRNVAIKMASDFIRDQGYPWSTQR